MTNGNVAVRKGSTRVEFITTTRFLCSRSQKIASTWARKRKYTTFPRQHARHRCENGNVRRCGAENPTTSIQDSQNVKSKK